MVNKVVHFEVPYDDEARARAFYEQAFGWDVMTIPGFEGYAMATVGPTDPEKGPTEPGFINGALMQRTEKYATCDFVLDTDNIESSLEAVEAAGGVVVSRRQAVGEMGFTAYVRDTEGNLVGLWESAT
jgi:predicted enzyme related to lactoylglutathione lyase